MYGECAGNFLNVQEFQAPHLKNKVYYLNESV